MATPQRYCYCQRRRSYKQMVQDVADNLGAEDVQKIVFIHDLPTDFNGKPALAALRHLEIRGHFNECETDRLESLLRSINRFDLINRHVLHYRKSRLGCTDRGMSVPELAPADSLTTPSSSPKPHPPSSVPTVITSHSTEQSDSTHLKPDERRELCHLLTKYVPREVIRKSIWEKFSLDIRRTVRRTIRSTGSLEESQVDRDGPSDDAQWKRKATTPTPAYTTTEKERGDDLEWVMLDPSVADSGTASASGSSFDDSLDIDIGDFCKNDKPEHKPKFSNKQRSYFTWRIRRSEFMKPLFQHTHKTFEKKIKLCMGPRSPCLPISFKLFPNGIGSDENIYSSLRIALPSASQMVPAGTSLVFSITVRDLQSADILASQHMEVGLEKEEYMLEQFLAHEVIKSSEARQLEIRIMTKINASSSGWVEIQTSRN